MAGYQPGGAVRVGPFDDADDDGDIDDWMARRNAAVAMRQGANVAGGQGYDGSDNGNGSDEDDPEDSTDATDDSDDSSQSSPQSPFPALSFGPIGYVPGLLGDLSRLSQLQPLDGVSSRGAAQTVDDNQPDADQRQDVPPDARPVVGDTSRQMRSAATIPKGPAANNETASNSGLPAYGARKGDASTSSFDWDPIASRQLSDLNLDPAKPIWALGAVSAPSITFPRSSLLSVNGVLTPKPPIVPGQPSTIRSTPSAGFLGSLFPWAVPTPGDHTLKSAMVTAPEGLQVGPDPSRVDVFQRGADGQLHPIPSWHTTGPADFGSWAHEIDWDGVGHDLEHIANSVLDVEGIKAAGEAFLDALGPGVKNAVQKGIFGPGQQHHPIPKFMGGAADQSLVDMATPMHREFHKELQSELREAGFPPVGGTAGSTKVWLDRFEANSAERNKALDILQRTARNFDISRGTSINPYLDKEHEACEPAVVEVSEIQIG